MQMFLFGGEFQKPLDQTKSNATIKILRRSGKVTQLIERQVRNNKIWIEKEGVLFPFKYYLIVENPGCYPILVKKI